VAGDHLPAERPTDPPPRPRGDRDGIDERPVRRLALAGALVLVVSLVLIFVIENSERVRVSFVFFSAEISLIWVMVLSGLAGAAVGVLLYRTARRRWFGG
jgi:uncharacterized integral membrane protein